jgi:hypothetical protein
MEEADVIEFRLRNRANPATVAAQVGKQLTDGDIDVLLTGAARVLKPDGRPLAVYLPGFLAATLDANPDVYDILHGLRSQTTVNRGRASASHFVRPPGQKMSVARPVASSVVGAVDPIGGGGGIYRYCRLTAWTGRHMPEFGRLAVLFKAMATAFAEHVPERYRVQADYAARTDPAWVVPGTPFTTITVNNTYATGVHKDNGDLATGFSCLATLRRGHYDGGRLVFPEFRTGIDMGHGDLVLMDAHDWHGNTDITCPHGAIESDVTDCPHCRGERISVVCYYRERMTECGGAADEDAKAQANADRRSGKVTGHG